MRKVSRENWEREDRNTDLVVGGLLVLLLGAMVCGTLSAFLLLLSLLSITL